MTTFSRLTHFLLGLAPILPLLNLSVSGASVVPKRDYNDVSACKLAADKNVYLSLGFGSSALDCAHSVGVLNVFMFFVDFPDEGATETTPQELYDFLVPEAKQWYTNSSYGALELNVTADINGGFYRMPKPAETYGWERGLTSETHEVYIQDALESYLRRSTNKGIGSFDVLYIVPTKNATSISFSPTFMGEVRTRDGTYVSKKCVTFGYDAYRTWRYKVLNHETGHTMCLPDLYPYAMDQPTGLYVGGWDMMGYINGPGPDYLAWNKWRLGWLNDEHIDCVASASNGSSTTHVISPLGISSGGGYTGSPTKAVVITHKSTTALVAEARSRVGVDSELCGTGVLLYTVSTTVATGLGPIQVLDANPASGGCEGDELNDAPLTLTGTSSYNMPEWGFRVTVIGEIGDEYSIQVAFE